MNLLSINYRYQPPKPTSEDIISLLKNEQKLWSHTPRKDYLRPLNLNNLLYQHYSTFFKWAKLPSSEVWDQYNQIIVENHNQPKTCTLLKSSEVCSKMAIVIGCGVSNEITNLLNNDFIVIGIDNSTFAINKCKEIFSSFIAYNRLFLECMNIEEYIFPNNIQVIYANNVLHYIEPMQLKPLLCKIQKSLGDNGRFYGDLNANLDQTDEIIQRGAFRGWSIPTDEFDPEDLAIKLLGDCGFQEINTDFTGKKVEFRTQKLSSTPDDSNKELHKFYLI